MRNRTVNHVVIAHNTFDRQVFAMGFDSVWNGTLSLIANNTAPGMVGAAGTVTVKNNHVQSTGTQFNSGSLITGGVGDTIGGSSTTIFVDAAAGDFRPAGELLLNAKEPVLALESSVAATATIAAGALFDT